MEDQGTSMGKDTSLKVTKEVKFGTTVGDLRVYNEDLTPRDYDSLPLITLKIAEDLDKFQYGIIRICINEGGIEKSYLVNIDGVMSLIYSVYAKNLNEMRSPNFRQKAVRFHGLLKTFFNRLIIKNKNKKQDQQQN